MSGDSGSDSDADATSVADDGDWSAGPTGNSVTTRGGITVSLLKDEIQNAQADAILCTCGKDLDLSVGAVSSSLLTAAGPGLQTELSQYYPRGLSRGKVGRTKGYKLSCKRVYHATLLDWSRRTAKDNERVLRAILRRSLQLANREKMQSIAWPTIGCGNLSYPKDVVAAAMFDEVRRFSAVNQSSTLRDVIIVIFKGARAIIEEYEKQVELLQCPRAVSSTWATRTTPGSLRSRSSARAGSPRAGSPRAGSPRAGSARVRGRVDLSRTMPNLFDDFEFDYVSAWLGTDFDSDSGAVSDSVTVSGDWTAGPTNNAVITSEGVTLSVFKGSISREQVDVILCTCGKDLNLSVGAVSKTLLTAAGPGLQTALSANYPQGLGKGQVGRTGGYKLSCTSVYHATLLPWDRSKSAAAELVLCSILQESLKLANKENMSSIAWPTIGCGKLNYPRNVVAAAMFDEVRRFSAANQNTSLRDVRIIVYDGDQTTIDEFLKHLQSARSCTLVTQPRSSRASTGSSARTLDGSGLQHAAVEEFSQFSSDLTQGPPVKIGDVTFEVIYGDLTTLKCDVIVSGTNDRLSMPYGPLSAAILQAGGQSIADECSRIGKLTNGMALTKAGKLPCKFIIHHSSWSDPWDVILKNCMTEADRRGLTSIALPLLGSDRNLGWMSLLAVTSDTVTIFASSAPKHLRRVTVVLHNPAIDKQVSSGRSTSAHTTTRQKIPGPAVPVKKTSGQAAASQTTTISKTPSKTTNSQTATAQTSTIPAPFVQTNTAKTATVQPAPVKRATVSRTTFHPTTVNPTTVNPTTVNPTTVNPTTVNPTTVNPTTVNPAIVNPATVNPTLLRPTPVPRTTFQTNPVQPTLVQPAAVQPAAVQSVTVQPPPIQPANVQPAAVQQTTVIQPTTVQISDDKTITVRATRDETSAPGQIQINVTVVQPEAENNPGVLGTIKRFFGKSKAKDATAVTSSGPGAQSDAAAAGVAGYTAAQGSHVGAFGASNTGHVIPLPATWTPMPKGQSTLKRYQLVTLNTTDQEYKDVMKNFALTTLTIVSIERIQNPDQYYLYMTRKEMIDAVNGKTPSNERRLWHGTAEANLKQINGRNFNRSYCGQHGTVYGNGVYFATNSAYSVNAYCPPTAQTGLRYIYQVRVLTGKFTKGAGGMLEPPHLPGDTEKKFDSVVDNERNPSMFVIFHDVQSYPEYLVTFK